MWVSLGFDQMPATPQRFVARVRPVVGVPLTWPPSSWLSRAAVPAVSPAGRRPSARRGEQR